MKTILDTDDALLAFDRWRELYTIARSRSLTSDERSEFKTLCGKIKPLITLPPREPKEI